MLARLLLLFVIVPLVELTLLSILADKTHWWVSVTLVVVTGFIGTLLARSQGAKTYRRIHEAISRGQIPTDALIDAGMILAAGALLLTPGMLTDVLGISLLVPWCRDWYRLRLVRWFRARFTVQTASTAERPAGRSEVVDSYVVPPKPTTIEPTTIESGSDEPT